MNSAEGPVSLTPSPEVQADARATVVPYAEGATPRPAEARLLADTVDRRWIAACLGLVAVMYALLWSPNWYPLSDSSLYLSLGRSFAAGRGLTMMGDTVKLTPPLAPLLIALIMKLGGGIGAIQAVMTLLMLVARCASWRCGGSSASDWRSSGRWAGRSPTGCTPTRSRSCPSRRAWR
jgi:hypothetical protein